MYDAIEDPYCYPGTTVLKNRAGHRTQRALTQFETAMSAQRADEPLPIGRLSVHHYQAVHRHLFQDVYPWARAGSPSRLFLLMRPGVEGIENRNARRLKIRYIPRHHDEAVLKRRRCNCEIKLFVAELCCKSTPSARNPDRQR